MVRRHCITRTQRRRHTIKRRNAVQRGSTRTKCDKRIHGGRFVRKRFEANAEKLEIDEDNGQKQQELRERKHHQVLIAQKTGRQWPAKHMSHAQIE